MRIIGALNHYLMSSIIIGLIIFCLLKVLEILLKKIIKKEHAECRLITCIFQFIFIVYLVGVLSITGGYIVFIEGFPEFFMSANLIPVVNTIQDIIGNPPEMISQIGYNIALFVPFGFLLPYSFPNNKWNWKRVLLFSVITILIVEGLEFLSGRYFDVDDIIINGTGSLLGYGAYQIIHVGK